MSSEGQRGQVGAAASGRVDPAAAGTGRITVNLLTLAAVAGAAGAPIIGALREGVQERFGLSFLAVGAGVAVLGILAGAAGLAIVRSLPGVRRLTFIRVGLGIVLAGFLAFALADGGGPASVALLIGGWFILTLGRSLGAVSNAVFTDLWRKSPHTGVILLHATNSLGKLLAPLLALVLAAELSVNALAYGGIVALLCLDAWTWPRAGVGRLAAAELAHPAEAATARNAFRGRAFWIVFAEFLIIAGSEAGVVSVVPSFIERARPPLWGLTARGYSELVLAGLNLGIVLGRFVGVAVSRRAGERAIIRGCLVCVLGAVPAVLARHPAIYLSGFVVLGVAFSATWPANFALAARAFPRDKTALSMAATVGTLTGVNGFVLLSSLLGSAVRLEVAILASAASMGLFAWSFLKRRPPVRQRDTVVEKQPG